ncbi:hypothetical protein [Microbacterium sp. A93]|uniref:hypothetical protein n=1 Tax=Microbacterium sp. A93 TaxID=3450716 RepID=UPI003F444B76
MATSNDGPSDPHGVMAFIRSRPNLVGLLVFLAVFLATVLASQSPAAAVLAGLLGYGAGYLLTPATAKTYASGIPVHGATRQDMTERLDEFQRTVRQHRSHLPPRGDHELSVLGNNLREMIARWEDVAHAPEQRMVLESVVYQYLPNTLEVFLRIPDSAKPAAAPEWTGQLQVLSTEVARSRDAVLKHDLEAMRHNGRVLEQRFEDGDLKMFRENGL